MVCPVVHRLVRNGALCLPIFGLGLLWILVHTLSLDIAYSDAQSLPIPVLI
jgi:hypothetical protein